MYLSKNSESLNLIGLKGYILETKILEEQIPQNYPHKEWNFFKKMASYQQFLTRKLFLKL